MKVWRTVKWSNVRNRYVFTNRNIQQTTIKKEPRSAFTVWETERDCSLMLLKEKGDWGQQTLQALVEFQCKAVKTQQTITFIDAICLVSGAPHSDGNSQNSENGEKRSGETTTLTLSQAKVPTLVRVGSTLNTQ